MEIYGHIHNCWLPLTRDWTKSHVGILTSDVECKQYFLTAYANAFDSWTMMENHSAQREVPSSVPLYAIQPINYEEEK